MRPEGWYRDPYGIHDDRWFSDGQPTSLVRDRGIESSDEPPHDRLLPSAPGLPAGEQLPPPRARTVLLPGLLTLAVWCLAFPLFFFVALPMIALLAAGLRIPGWRPAIVVILWVAFALSCICIPLLLVYTMASLMGGSD